ncbi:MAG: type III-B CRISPR module-associated protein Cmr5 [Chloroflexota bacterium]
MSQATPAQQPATSRRQSLEQQRAAQAASDIREAKQRSDSGEYRSLVEGLPAMIQANGLGQTCAYLLSRAEGNDKSVECLLYGHLERWVQRQIPQLQQGGLLAALTNADVGTYRRAQVEALAYLQWLKRFAQAELPRGERQRS